MPNCVGNHIALALRDGVPGVLYMLRSILRASGYTYVAHIKAVPVEAFRHRLGRCQENAYGFTRESTMVAPATTAILSPSVCCLHETVYILAIL